MLAKSPILYFTTNLAKINIEIEIRRRFPKIFASILTKNFHKELTNNFTKNGKNRKDWLKILTEIGQNSWYNFAGYN